MTDVEIQNRKYLDYAAGGAKPVYVWPHDAPNAPARPMEPEDQHMMEMEKAISLETKLIRQWVNDQQNRDAAVKRVQDVLVEITDTLNEAIYYENDITRFEIYPRFVAYKRYLGVDK